MALTTIDTYGIKDGAVQIDDIGTLAGNLTINDSGKLRLGTGLDLQIFHDGNHSFIKDTGTGNLALCGSIIALHAADATENMILCSQNGAVQLYYDNSKKFETYSSGTKNTGHFIPTATETYDLGDNSLQWRHLYVSDAVNIKDNGKAIFGAGDDLQIYHDGSHSRIKDTGTGNLKIDTNFFDVENAAGTENMIHAAEDGAVELYFNGSKKFETASYGFGTDANVRLLNDNGSIQFGASQDFKLYHDGNYNILKGEGAHSTQFWTNNNARWRIQAGGHIMPEASNTYDIGTSSYGVRHVYLADTAKLQLGASQDLQIYHDGTNSFISNGTGELLIRAKTGENSINCNPDGAVELYYNNSKKLETLNGGGKLTGQWNADGFDLDDNANLYFGTGNDLKIYHNGSHSYIWNTQGDLQIRSNSLNMFSTSGEQYFQGTSNGAVELYYDNSKKFETTSYGNLSAAQIRVSSSNASTVAFSCGDAGTGFYNTGSNAIGYSANGTQKWNINSGGHLNLKDSVELQIGTGYDLLIYHDGSHSRIHQDGTGYLIFQVDDFLVKNEANNKNLAHFLNGAGCLLYYDNSKKFETTSAGVTVTGVCTATSFVGVGGSTSINFLDNVIASWGTGNDLRLYHDGSNSYIADEGVGDIIISSGTITLQNQARNETHADFIGNGACKLYYDNSKKFETTSDGASVTGSLGINTTESVGTLQIGNKVFSGGNGIYNNSRVYFQQNTYLGAAVLADTYNDGTHPNYGLVFIQGPNTSSYNVWSVSPDGPSKGNSLNFHYGAQATNIHSPGHCRVSMTGTGDWVPYSNNASDLGTSSKRWRKLYATDIDASGTISGAGKVLQVLQEVKTGVWSESVGMGAKSGSAISKAITLTSNSNKVLVTASITFGASGTANRMALVLEDGSGNELFVHDNMSNNMHETSASTHHSTCHHMAHISFTYLHNPSSSTTYHVKIRHGGSGTQTMYLNRAGCESNNGWRNRGASSIVLMEVAA